eukprot:TRINITY_DN17418_c0_g1_i1.p1 TRINITY_DN17418_c0_g1~~TRINITY_DN17418_c0_g1_i1.p1  ORF type:complete len:257 (-),score=43.91 TRINITY_DN17418_c0_g1_i1:151-921(-)
MARHDIEITDGIGERTSRLGLKKKMQMFGEVDACHMGNRGSELPLVRFKTLSAAESALQALKSGQVFLDGFPLKGEWRGTTHVKRTADPSRDADRREAEQDLTSRDLMYGSIRPRVEQDLTSRDLMYGTRPRATSPYRPPTMPFGGMPMLRDRPPSPCNGPGGFSGGPGGGRSRSRKRKRSRSRSRKRRSSSRTGRSMALGLGPGGLGGASRMGSAATHGNSLVARATVLKGADYDDNAAAAAAVSDNPLFRGDRP